MTHLVCAPVPRGLDGESEHQAGPGQVSCDGVPEDVEGVWSRCVTLLADVHSDEGGDGFHVLGLEARVASHLVESCGHKQEFH